MTQSPMIDVAELAGLIGKPGVSILDASWYLPSDKRDTRAEYQAAHIPGAVFFDIDGVSDASSGLPHTLAQPEVFEAAMRKLGINTDDQIVIYDSAGLFSAARAWWNFRVAGSKTVRVLNGGLPAWTAAGQPVESGDVQRAPGNFVAWYDLSLVRTFSQMLSIVQSGGAEIVDARGAPRFNGEVAEPRPGLTSGHISGSQNLPFSNLIENGRLKTAVGIKAAFDTAGVNTSRPIVTTCGSGVTASILTLGLAVLGRTDVPVYDGSWSEWGGRPESADYIATGA
ncbi:3-mercaptopyruvate sulfurtransferase [Devosia sp.]|uniref:3-mercaptopyruvate sulfurtransferase n=1 Tax=Devosia sp. TaxID=1871048 RepID=UPI003267284C